METLLRKKIRSNLADEINDLAENFILLGGYALPLDWEVVKTYSLN